jgi:L-threonylcarbamoyladenylate synthase
MIVLMNGDKMMHNVFQEIPEIGLANHGFTSENPTLVLLDNQEM